MADTRLNLSFLSRLKNTVLNKSGSLPDITGKTLGEFHAERRMDIPSGEADIYLCSGTGSHAGERFVLKYYRRENAVKQEVLEKLGAIKSPCVAQVAGYGEYEGHQYAVRPYYEMPALSEVLASGTTITEEELKVLVIPSVIEGLKAVHDAGILHKDLKPANLIPDDTGEHIILIDFGISSDAGKNTFVVTETGMTPFYAAPEAMQGLFHKETDYYALGITVFELFTGFTPFQNPGLSPEEAARLASVSKIEFPENFPEDLKKLVLGLTYKDISHRNEKDNPNRRWGYDEVKRWLRGEEVPVPGEASASGNAPFATVPSFQAYRFCGKTYTSETELLRTMLRHPEDALKDLGRGFLSHHYYAFSEKKGELCNAAETKLGNNVSGNLRQLFSLIYRLSPDIRDIPYNGGILESIQDLGKSFIDAGIREASENGSLRGRNTKHTKPVRDFVMSGIPEDYAVIVLKNTGLSRLFENTGKLWNQESRPDSDTELALIIGYSLCDERRIPVHGRVYDSPEAFCREMKELSQKDRKAYTVFMQAAKADLDFLEQRLPDAASREFISKAREDSKWAVFGDNEYHFRNGEDFRNYIEKLVREEKPYELQSLWNRYKTPLKDVSEKVWNTDSRAQLERIVSGFIRVGEHLFTGEKQFREFLTGVISRGKTEPAFLLGFIRAHKNSLNQAAKVFPRIRECVSELYAAGDRVIVLDEHMFPGTDEFRTFIDSAVFRGKSDPGYLAGFLERHQEALKRLGTDDTVRKILEPLNEAFRNLIFFDCRIFADPEDFEQYISGLIKKGADDPRFLVSFSEKHHQEITDLWKRDRRCQKALSGLRTARNRIVAFDEYVFSSMTEFRNFAADILKTGEKDPAHLRRFVQAHEKALTRLNGVGTLSAAVKPLLDAGNSVIEVDEYAFRDSASFESFRAGLAGNDGKEILRVSDFAGEHHKALSELESNTSAAAQAKELLNSAKAVLKEEAISVNGVKYSPGIRKGDLIKFGNYPMEANGQKEPIEWLVLEVRGNEALLISRYGLDCRQYHHKYVDMTWENCDLRKWLNHDFLKAAFSPEESARIKVSELRNDDNPRHGTGGGNSTKDRVFCLSIAEAERYFRDNKERQCQPTEYARNQGAWVDDSNGCCCWWLRSPGDGQRSASYVATDGALNLNGLSVGDDLDAVRPALRIICNR